MNLKSMIYPYPYLNRREAGAAGFCALTIGYRLPQEQSLIDRVLADLRRGKIPHCLVKGRDGVAVWRSLRTATIGGACTHLATSGACTQSFRTSTNIFSQRNVTTRKGQRL